MKIAVCYNDDWHYRQNLNDLEKTADGETETRGQ